MRLRHVLRILNHSCILDLVIESKDAKASSNSDKNGKVLQMLAFNASEEFFREPGDEVVTWFQPTINEWQGARTVEGRLLHVTLLD